jgi:hypothetical protein
LILVNLLEKKITSFSNFLIHSSNKGKAKNKTPTPPFKKHGAF